MQTADRPCLGGIAASVFSSNSFDLFLNPAFLHFRVSACEKLFLSPPLGVGYMALL